MTFLPIPRSMTNTSLSSAILEIHTSEAVCSIVAVLLFPLNSTGGCFRFGPAHPIRFPSQGNKRLNTIAAVTWIFYSLLRPFHLLFRRSSSPPLLLVIWSCDAENDPCWPSEIFIGTGFIFPTHPANSLSSRAIPDSFKL